MPLDHGLIHHKIPQVSCFILPCVFQQLGRSLEPLCPAQPASSQRSAGAVPARAAASSSASGAVSGARGRDQSESATKAGNLGAIPDKIDKLLNYNNSY